MADENLNTFQYISTSVLVQFLLNKGWVKKEIKWNFVFALSRLEGVKTTKILGPAPHNTLVIMWIMGAKIFWKQILHSQVYFYSFTYVAEVRITRVCFFNILYFITYNFQTFYGPNNSILSLHKYLVNWNICCWCQQCNLFI